MGHLDPSGIPPARKAELNRFVSDLSPWEILHLRNLVLGRQIQLAGLEDVPPEIVCYLIAHLDLEDIIACRSVSKGWARAWSHDAVLTSLCRRFAPGVCETFPNATSRQLFVEAMRRKKKRQMARFFDKKMILWDSAWDTDVFKNVVRPHSINRRGPEFVRGNFTLCYADGKMTWQHGRDIIIVDDLFEKTRFRFAWRNPKNPLATRQSILLAASNKLIVFQDPVSQDHRHVIYITHMEKQGEVKALYLPGVANHCYVEGEFLGVVTAAGVIIVWTWEGKAIELDLGGVETPTSLQSWSLPVLLPHPTQHNIVFAVWPYEHSQPDKRLFTFVVAKFEDARLVWQSSTSIANPLTNPDDACGKNTSWIRMDFNPQKADNFGSYSLGIYRLQGRFHGVAEFCTCHADPWRPGDWGAIAFNVLSQTFSRHYYECPRKKIVWDTEDQYGSRTRPTVESFLENAHLWNQDLLLTWRSDYEMGMQILHPVGSVLSRRHQHPLFQSMQTAGPAGSEVADIAYDEYPARQSFQSDRWVFVPTSTGVWACELSEFPVAHTETPRPRSDRVAPSPSQDGDSQRLVRLTHGIGGT
ncbi:hypothetical protein BKA56DRAFT_65532 [Ilyonectria sp. MPI-CAGE-AT-0026]|nr:hypothetical protein BKA56DRAFT_65532 [Ilyonectria sp. MPI-CAGE-AT-0026]